MFYSLLIDLFSVTCDLLLFTVFYILISSHFSLLTLIPVSFSYSCFRTKTFSSNYIATHLFTLRQATKPKCNGIASRPRQTVQLFNCRLQVITTSKRQSELSFIHSLTHLFQEHNFKLYGFKA